MQVEYTKSFQQIEHYDLKELPTVAFLGRSNVGKSSLMNHLLSRKKLVQTSRTAGKTKMFNFFTLENKQYWADMPGYGFANVPKHVRRQWQDKLINFLLKCPSLRLVIQLVDIRHAPSEEDLLFQQFLQGNSINHLVVATKGDQVRPSAKQKNLKMIKTVLELGALPLLSSTKENFDKAQILHQIELSLKNHS